MRHCTLEANNTDPKVIYFLNIRLQKITSSSGYFIKPTIFTNVTPQMSIVREEIFGPVVVFIKFKTEQGVILSTTRLLVLELKITDVEVIGLANDTVYGLSCAVFSENINRALRVAHSLQAGSAFVRSHHPEADFLVLNYYVDQLLWSH